MRSYKPLFSTLEEKEVSLDDLVKRKFITKTMRDHINNGEDVPMRVIGKLCNTLRCDVDGVLLHVKSEKAK